MLRRLRRPAALLLPALLAASLVACGDEEGSGGNEPSGDGSLSSVSISGEVGEAPTVEWDGELQVDEIVSDVVVEGEGAELEEGDQVSVNFWLGNGFTQEEAFSTYGEDAQPETLTVGGDLSEFFQAAVEGHTLGSRVAVAAPASEAFGEGGNPQLGIGNGDSVLLVADLMEIYTPPKPKTVPQAQMPDIVEENGEPVALDFTGIPAPKPTDDLKRTVVEQGDGKVVTPEMTVTADYLGMVHGATKPFDESYSQEPVPFSLSGVVKGWTYGLSGVKVGSRVLLAIPPELGYGAKAQPGIPADSTLYFVVDILKAK